MLAAIPALAHKNIKNIKQGVIHPRDCADSNHSSSHNLDETLHCGMKSGFTIQSPARKYHIRPADNAKVKAFITKHKSLNVHAILHIGGRAGAVELWKVSELNPR